MTREDLLLALTDMDAQDLRETERIMTEGAAKIVRRPLRRVLVAAAVAAALLLAAFTVAMAASEGFREDVRRVFHIQAKERVVSPAESPDADALLTNGVFTLQKKQTLDGMEVRYYSAEGNLMYVFRSNGLVYSPPRGEAESGTFYRLTDGDLPGMLTAQHATAALEYQGMRYTVAYDWMKCGEGWIVQLGKSEPYLSAVMIDAQPDRRDVWLLSSRITAQDTQTLYPLLLDVPTGTVSDPLDGLVPKDHPIVAWEFSRDGQFLLARDEDGRAWMYDLVQRTGTELNTLLGASYLECRMLSDGQVACFAYEDSVCHARRYDPADGSLHVLMQTAEGERLTLAGPIYSNSGYIDYAQLTDASGTVSLLDLHDGMRIPLDGIVSGESFVVWESPSGGKLLFAIYAPGSVTVERLGVLDLRANTYTELTREAGSTVEEYDMVWLDEDSFAVRTASVDGRTGIHIYTLRARE